MFQFLFYISYELPVSGTTESWLSEYSNSKEKKITHCDVRRRQLHKTTLIANKLTCCAQNIQKHYLGSNSVTLTGVMIPVGVSYYPNSLELSLFCLLSSLLFVHAANLVFISISVSFEVI